MILAKRHDASKGAYKRPLKNGLTAVDFADYFAEVCFRSYNDEKYELTAEELAGYYNNLKVRASANDTKTTASDFLEDLCANLCLMYFEGDRYYFTHRSFQEYLRVLFFSKQKDKFITKLGDFFEKHRRRMYGDRTFYMLYDMIPEKVEEYIFLPYLTDLFDKCDKLDGYWTFLDKMYPNITYSSYEEFHLQHIRWLEPCSFIFRVTLEKCGIEGGDNFLIDLPYYKELEIEGLPRMRQKTTVSKRGELINIEEVGDEKTGYVCSFNVLEVRNQPDDFKEPLNVLNDDRFVFKQQYHATQQYMKQLSAKKKAEDDSLLDLL